MKINFKEPLCSCETRKRLKRTLIFAMRTSIFYMAFVISSIQLLLANHEGKGQAIDSIYVTLDEEESLRTLFRKIEKQTPLRFSYYEDQVHEQITLPKNEMSVKEALDLVVARTNLTYLQLGSHIVVRMQARDEKGIQFAIPGYTSSPDQAAHAISGTVTDATSNTPLPGVNVIVKETTKGTTTDAEGRYVIDVNDSDVLVFSFVGYKPHEVHVHGRTVIDVKMTQDISNLKEVVINAGYYTTTDKAKTGNIVKVSAKDIENQPITSPLMALQGRVPGLEIIPTSGTPGSAPTIRIRGINSLRNRNDGQNGNYPLYIIDGLAVDSRPVQSVSGSFMATGFDPLSTINPNNIESIEVLKDGDATAIYGSRGANGVILIKTKQFSTSNKTTFGLDVYSGIGEVVSKMDLLNTSQYLRMRREAYQNDGLTPSGFTADDLLRWDTTRHTDWQEKLLGRTANITDLQATISGSSGNTSFSLGGGFHKETMVLPGDCSYQRASAQLHLNHASTDQKFKATTSLSYGYNKHKLFDDANFVSLALALPPVAPSIYDENGDLNWELNEAGTETWTNPFSFLKKTNDAISSNWITNSSLSYQILPELQLKTNLGYTQYNSDEVIKVPIASLPPSQINPSRTASTLFGTNIRTSWIIEPQLTYYKSLHHHELDAVLGTTWQKSNSVYQSMQASGYTSDVFLGTTQGAGVNTFSSDNNIEYKYAAVFARIGYTFNQKYLLNLTGRRDGSSRFGPGNRFGNFGAIGIAWIFSKEGFLKDAMNFLSFGKVRSSYGTTGNDQIGDYQWYDAYAIKSYRYQNATSLSPASLYNPDYAWEVTKKFEVAIELGFIEDRISLEVDWYRNRSSNQLIQSQLPRVTGFSSLLANFDALVENSGWEAIMNTTNIKANDVTWTTSINVSVPRNKLVRFDNIDDSQYSLLYKVGQPLTIGRFYTWNGINPQTGLHQVLDTNGDNFFNDADKKLMDLWGTKFYGGINNSVRFRSFELSFLFQFNKQYSAKYMPSVPAGRNNQEASVFNRWRQEGDITDVQKFTTIFSGQLANIRASQSDYNVQDASFLRLKTLSLSYKLPEHTISKLKVEDARVYLQGQNLYTYTNYIGLDPETGSFTLPPLRVLNIGVHLKF